MGDVSTGLGYLCGTCCCLRDTVESADGSRFRSGPKPDPRERAVDEMFMMRDYRQDAAGRFVRQPTPTSAMHSRYPSDRSSEAGVKKGANLEVPPLAVVDSTSTGGSSGSQTKEPLDAVPESLPPLG